MVEFSFWPVFQLCQLTFFITFKNLTGKRQTQSQKMPRENGYVFIPFANILPCYGEGKPFWQRKWRFCLLNLFSLFNPISFPLSTLLCFIVISLPFLIKTFTFFRFFLFYQSLFFIYLSRIYYISFLHSMYFLFSSVWH